MFGLEVELPVLGCLLAGSHNSVPNVLQYIWEKLGNKNVAAAGKLNSNI